eukprot:354574-Chlamydomonas_euryale.AAC.11
MAHQSVHRRAWVQDSGSGRRRLHVFQTLGTDDQQNPNQVTGVIHMAGHKPKCFWHNICSRHVLLHERFRKYGIHFLAVYLPTYM